MELLWMVPALPFAGCFFLALAGSRLTRPAVAVVGVGSVGAAAVAAVLAAVGFSRGFSASHTQTLWLWWHAGALQPAVALYLDALSVVMIVVVTVVGFFIHLYSVEFMTDDDGYARFFVYMNLFVGSMLVLVLADNFLLLYLGWEGVGLCSYLLIGFWYENPRNGYAARKAFVVTRIGDTAMAVGLLLLFTQLGTLNIQQAMLQAREVWHAGSVYPTAAALLLLGGAVGKSAQLPLQTWLPDAMAGPSPVSALIHAATMVTAGVYLIARTHLLFSLAPAVLTLTAVLGALTLLVAGFSGLVQNDIKRVLAYSTISQIGYMFLALGVGAWTAAVFHFMTHAFFKALLFLGAGAVIRALDDEHDMFRMGGLRRQLPTTFWTFLIGGGALAAVPLLTAGFYSKDKIIWLAYAADGGSGWLWAAALVGAFLTSLYTFRLVFRVFFGTLRTRVRRRPGWLIKLPLICLALLSIVAGFVELPSYLGDRHQFSAFLSSALPAASVTQARQTWEALLAIVSMAVSLGGIGLVYVFVLGRPRLSQRLARSPVGIRLQRLWFSGWGFDALYERLVEKPYLRLAQLNRSDRVDRLVDAVIRLNRLGFRGLSLAQSGRLRAYAMGIAGGAMLIIGVVLFL